MNLCIFTVFSLFLVYGIKPILSSHRQSFLRFFKNKNFDLQLFFFRVNITHHEGDFFCFVSCVLQDVSISMKVSGKGKDVATKQGNRRLQATIYFLAIQMVQVSSKGTPRNSVVRAYYEKRKAEGKTSQQALICISRRLISIIYGMLKHGTEYRMPVVESAGENR